jgi:hypothetical protein
VVGALLLATVTAAELRSPAPAPRRCAAVGRGAALAAVGVAARGVDRRLSAAGAPTRRRLIGFDLVQRAHGRGRPPAPASRYLELAPDFGWRAGPDPARRGARLVRAGGAAALVVPAALLAWPLAMGALLSASSAALVRAAGVGGLALAAGAGAGQLAPSPPGSASVAAASCSSVRPARARDRDRRAAWRWTGWDGRSPPSRGRALGRARLT